MALADRIETFCNELIKTNNQRKAYRAAYPSAEKWKDATVDSKASVFAKTDKVLERLEELRADLSKETKTTQTDIINELKAIGFAEIDINNIKPTDKLKALELIARMLGLDKPETDEGDSVLKELLKEFKKI